MTVVELMTIYRLVFNQLRGIKGMENYSDFRRHTSDVSMSQTVLINRFIVFTVFQGPL